MAKSKAKYVWKCSWTNGKGGYNPDYECCNAKGRECLTAKSAAEKGQAHVQCHEWGRWGYPNDPNWRDGFVCVVKKHKNKEQYLGTCKEVLLKIALGDDV